MPSIITAGTASNTALNLTGDTSGELQLKTNNGSTTAMTLTTGGNVGIGTDAPTAPAAGQISVEIRGSSGRGNLLLSTAAADGAGVITGAVAFNGGASTSGSSDVRTALIYSATEGTTANQRGGNLVFVTKPEGGNTTERMRIDSSGNVGIGTTGPGTRLEVSASQPTRGVIATFTNSFSATKTGSQIVFSQAGLDNWAVGMPGGASSAFVLWNGRASGGDGTEFLRVNDVGNLVLRGGTATASGVGVTFPATQSASSDANTLDDYEEGTWTPGILFGGGSTGVTYTASNGGYYTKVGRMVTVTFVLDVSNKGSSTGVAVMTGLPFSCINFQGGRGGVALGYTGGLSVNNPHLMADAGSGSMTFRTPNGVDMTNTAFGTNFNVYGSYSYFTS